MIVTVIPFNADDAPRVDRLCDLIYWLGGRAPVGHCLLVCDQSIHPEFKIKAKLSAEVAFKSVDMMEVGVPDKPKPEQINFVFKQAAKYVSDCYHQPWVWLEADCVPLKPTWQAELTEAYAVQPKRYLGRHMRAKLGLFLARTAIYPPDCFNDLQSYFDQPVPFERAAQIIPRTTNSNLFHIEKWAEGMDTGNSVIVNGDKTGVLVEQLIEKASTEVPAVTIPLTVKRGRGRPRKVVV